MSSAYLFTFIFHVKVLRTLGRIISFHHLRSAPDHSDYSLRFGLASQHFPLNSAIALNDFSLSRQLYFTKTSTSEEYEVRTPIHHKNQYLLKQP